MQTMQTDFITRVSRAYSHIQLAIGDVESSGTSSTTLQTVNRRILEAVSNEIKEKVSTIRALALQGIHQASDIIPKAEGIFDKADDDISRLPEMMGLSTYAVLRANIDQLLTSLREIAEEPVLIFPRCSCMDVPVNPARLISFKRQFQRLEMLNDADVESGEEPRSMTSAPRTAFQVIANVQHDLGSSIESVCVALEDLQRMEMDAEQLYDIAQAFMSNTRMVNDLATSLETVQALVREISSELNPNQTTGAATSPRSAQPLPPLESVRLASQKVQEMINAGKQLGESVEKVSALHGSFTDFMERLVEYSSASCKRISNIITTLQTLGKDLPRSVRELQAFFEPSGFASMILKPSDELHDITSSMEALKEVISAQQEVAQAAIVAVTEGCFDNSEDLGLGQEITELNETPRLVMSAIEAQDIDTTMYEALERVTQTLVAEIASDTVGDVMKGVLEASGPGGVVDGLGGRFKHLTGVGVPDGAECFVSSAVGVVDNLSSMPWARANPFA
eukprot:GFKZ01010319.1.p1 GENE.GFKZ01010319.1~~GFKZ01010319.1.p1  ORF type:complete len:508 (-),score=74.61 GFKZ01010319.1:161-1684(-)